MSTYNRQYAKKPLPFDFDCINLSVTDIPSDTVVVPDTTAANLLPLQDGFAVALPATGGNPGPVVGVTQEIVKASGTAARLRTAGWAFVTIDGAVTVGQYLDASTTTAGHAQAHVAGKNHFALALETGADQDVILVQLVGGGPNA